MASNTRKSPEVVHPLDGDDSIIWSTDVKVSRSEIARFSKIDAEICPNFFEDMSRAIQIMRRLLLETPIDS